MLNTLLANLKHAVRNCETATIGGGIYSPEELQQAINEVNDLRATNVKLVYALKGTMRTLILHHGAECRCLECANAREALGLAEGVL